MYIPAEFEVRDPARLHQIIRENNFGMLVSMVDGVAFATHLPFMIAPESGPHGTLLVHMARANPHWRSFGDEEVLVTFTGPHGYVSPSWYQPGNAVPTWDYIAVHAYGVPALVEDPAATLEHLRQLVDSQESCFEASWSLDAQDEAFVNATSRGVVAYEIPISRIEGKAKLSQNRSLADQSGVPADRELAAAMSRATG